jgi:hypothetical protein
MISPEAELHDHAREPAPNRALDTLGTKVARIRGDHRRSVWTRPWTVKQDFTKQSDEENRLYYEPRCVEGNYALPGWLLGHRLEERAFAEGRGPNPATKDDTAALVETEVIVDPLQ